MIIADHVKKEKRIQKYYILQFFVYAYANTLKLNHYKHNCDYS